MNLKPQLLPTQVEKYKSNLDKFRREHGEEAAQQLLSETKARNLAFYNLVLSEIKKESLASNTTTNSTSGIVVSPLPPSSPPPSPSVGDNSGATGAASGSRRRLMQSVADGADAGPDPTLSQEALSSFEVFDTEADDKGQQGGDAKDSIGDAQDSLGDEYDEDIEGANGGARDKKGGSLPGGGLPGGLPKGGGLPGLHGGKDREEDYERYQWDGLEKREIFLTRCILGNHMTLYPPH